MEKRGEMRGDGISVHAWPSRRNDVGKCRASSPARSNIRFPGMPSGRGRRNADLAFAGQRNEKPAVRNCSINLTVNHQQVPLIREVGHRLRK